MEKKIMNKKSILSNKNLHRILKFLVLFNIFAIPLYVIIFSGIEWYSLKKFTSNIVFASLQLTGMNPEIDGLLISIPIKDGKWAANIDWDCVGWKSMIAFFALVMATDFSKRKKLFGMLFIPVIYFINILRIWFMFLYVRIYDLTYYNIIHAIVWGWGLIIIVLILWVLWMKYIK
ncbi:MAG: exosortase/archaeosortase family protein [Candidatus Aenigmatarchaeota archaeon]